MFLSNKFNHSFAKTQSSQTFFKPTYVQFNRHCLLGYFNRKPVLNNKAKPMIPLLLIIAASAIQILLSVFRITGRVHWSIALITFLTFCLGFMLSITAVYIVLGEIPVVGHHGRCGTIGVAFLLCGCFVTFVFGLLIGVIAGFIYHFKEKSVPLNSASQLKVINLLFLIHFNGSSCKP
jgi:hypothetical protein